MAGSFPLLFSVWRFAFDSTAVDDLGNTVAGYGDPVQLKVYGWGAPQTAEPADATAAARELIDVALLVPPGFPARARDRFTLDDPAALYEVVGDPQMSDHNPFGWNPGGVLNLRRVAG